MARAGLEGVEVMNPYFEVTPTHLISGIVTEEGLIQPSEIAERMESMTDYVGALIKGR